MSEQTSQSDPTENQGRSRRTSLPGGGDLVRVGGVLFRFGSGARCYIIPDSPLSPRHGPARPGHLARHGAGSDGPDEPGHDG